MKQSYLLLLTLICSSALFAQKSRTLIKGNVVDSLAIVKNANVINTTTTQGTFTSDNGNFRMFVKLGDSLRISSIQHVTTLIPITKEVINKKSINIKIKNKTYVLDTFLIKRHNLTGRLDLDLKQVKTNKKDSLLRRTMDFSDIDMGAPTPNDFIDEKVRPHINETDPTRAFAGAGVSASIPFRYSKKLWALRKKLDLDKAFPYRIMERLGEKFFFEELKIPVERYFHFLEYCNPLGIEQLHKQNKILDIIKILKSESKTYLQIIKNE